MQLRPDKFKIKWIKIMKTNIPSMRIGQLECLINFLARKKLRVWERLKRIVRLKMKMILKMIQTLKVITLMIQKTLIVKLRINLNNLSQRIQEMRKTVKTRNLMPRLTRKLKRKFKRKWMQMLLVED